MKALKVIAAIVVSLLLLGSEGMAMGIFSVDRALSEETINKTIAETGIIDDLIDEALSDSTVSMAGSYGELVKSAMKTEAMNSFFAAYLTSAIRSEVYGEQYEEIADDDLMQAFSSALDEMESSGAIKISGMEESIIKGMIKKELPNLTEDLNSLALQYDTTNGQLARSTGRHGTDAAEQKYAVDHDSHQRSSVCSPHCSVLEKQGGLPVVGRCNRPGNGCICSFDSHGREWYTGGRRRCSGCFCTDVAVPRI